ncbi:MAG: DUF3276 family protein [Candidatus Fermentibacteraceae bacterium]
MSEERASVYEARVNSGKTTYFIDARRAVNGRYYLSITESRRTEVESFTQSRVILFEEGLAEFRKALNEAFEVVENLVERRGDEGVDEVRTLHPRAFSKWSPEDDIELEKQFRKNPDTAVLAGITGRSEKGVIARLDKMGLIQPRDENRVTAGS